MFQTSLIFSAGTVTFEHAMGAGAGTVLRTVLQEDGTELTVDADMGVSVGETVIVGDVIQSGDHVIQAGEFVIQAGDHVIQAGDHVIQAGDHQIIQAGDHHVIQAGDHHVIQAGDHHVIQAGEHVIQAGDVIQTVGGSKDVDQAESVATTEDLMALVGIGATNVVQQE